MIVKTGDAEILNVIEDSEHALDDEGTRKAMGKAAKIAKQPILTETPEKKILEN